ncbi:uncharacterized protein LY79DRAFT_557920 [Colletotrichum navitas]|uniref:Uncharacterized protein n=1 Tax=Colletotrichum navitas TaxID=681940 RepID=A0AAD8PX03_9PEZI|nr:uncharacterized protein LY79DRAFT_557920 [Colletotrichum navitas]KAK1585616.1 hypothetical protein LY79DRAFT_557920 [Colletotrichum navitas]
MPCPTYIATLQLNHLVHLPCAPQNKLSIVCDTRDRHDSHWKSPLSSSARPDASTTSPSWSIKRSELQPMNVADAAVYQRDGKYRLRASHVVFA